MENNKFVCKDHTVSNKEFELVYNADLEMYATHPQPKIDELPSYYKSDDYISHTDSNKSIFDKIYQIVKNYTLSKKVKLIGSFDTSDKRLLDIGCGTGDFLATAKNSGWEVFGVEPNDNARKLAAKKINKKGHLKKGVGAIVDSKNSAAFDVITLWHVLEHVPDLDAYISNLKSLLTKDGVLVVAVPNYKSYDAQHYKKYWAAYDVPRHLWHFSQKSIKLLFSKVEMKLEKIAPMYFDSFYVSILSEKHKTGKSNYIKAFWVGFLSNWKAIKSKEYSSLIYILKNR